MWGDELAEIRDGLKVSRGPSVANRQASGGKGELVFIHFAAVIVSCSGLGGHTMQRVAQRVARADSARLAVLGPFRSRRRFERMLPA